MNCENCNGGHNGSYGTGRFCTLKCARGFSTKNKRQEINSKVSQKTKGRKNLFTLEQRQKGTENSRKNRIEKQKNRIENAPFDNLTKGEKRIRIFNEQFKCCLICKNEFWNNISITLELDHIDGNRGNETRENLRLICPNCHSQTPTYKTKNATHLGKTKFSDDEIVQVLLTEESLYKVLLKLGLNPHGGNYKRLRRIIKERNIRQDLIF